MAEVKHSTRKHSKYAASASERWMNCLGSVKLSEKAPPQEDSPYAIEGTNGHECLEFIVKRFSNLEKAKIEAAKNPKWDSDMIEYAVTSAKVIFDLRPSKKAKLLTETRVVLTRIDKKLYGTLDYAWVDEWGELTVIDYKYGQGVAVYPCDENGVENSQLMYYALGIAYKYDFEFDSVKLVIVQPRVYNEEGKIFFEHKTTIKKLRDFEKRLITAYQDSKKPDAKLCSGDWCKWCPCVPICPEIGENQMRNADIFFDEEKGIQAMPEPGALTPERLPILLEACDKLETWIEKVREHAFSMAQKGTKIAGRKLVQKRSTRIWLPEAEAAAKKKFGNDAYSVDLLSPAQLEKKFGKDAKSFTEEYTTNISSGVTLVPESDKRPEIKDAVIFDI